MVTCHWGDAHEQAAAPLAGMAESTNKEFSSLKNFEGPTYPVAGLRGRLSRRKVRIGPQPD